MESVLGNFIKYLQNCEKENNINVEEARLKFENVIASIVAATSEHKPPSAPPSSIIGGSLPPFSASTVIELCRGFKGIKHLKMDTSEDGKTVDAESEIDTANGKFVITAKYTAKEEKADSALDKTQS